MRRLGVLPIVFLFLLTSCSLPLAASPSSTPSALPPIATLPPTQPPLILTATPTLPGPTLTSAPLPASTATPTHPATITVKIFLIALEDHGVSGPAVGCDDSVVPVEVTVPYTTGVLRAALEQLLAVKTPYYGMSGLYTALSNADLTIDELSVINGVATMKFSGTLLLGGVCDIPRVQAQLEQTALQFSTVQEVDIFLNGIPLDEALSLK